MKYVEVTGEALVRWLRRQVGPAIHVLREALGDLFPRFIGEHVSREGLPSRFRGVCKKAHLPAYLRETLSARVASVAV